MKNFQNICRAKRVPAESRAVFGMEDISGENRLEVRNEGDVAYVTVSGSIGKSWYDENGITAAEFISALNSIPVGKEFTVLVNSDGGKVQEGLEMYNGLKRRAADATCKIVGYAMSISSVWPLAASKVISPKSAHWMTHRASCGSYGNCKDKLADHEMLAQHDEMLAEIYAAETGKTKEEWIVLMDKETWIRGSKAAEFGLADEIDDSEAEALAIHPRLVSAFKNAGPEILNSFSAPSQGGKKQNQNESKTMNKKLEALCKKHGIEIQAGWTDDDAVSAIEAKIEATKKKSEKVENKTNDDESEESEPKAVNRLTAIEARLAKAEEGRVRATLKQYVTDQKITNDELEKVYLPAALKDEAGILAILDKKESALAGGDPLSSGRVEIVDAIMNPTQARGLNGPRSPILENIFKEHKTPKARHAAMKEVYDQALREALVKDERSGRGRDVFAANTYSGTLVTSFLMDGSLTDLTNVWAFMKAFSVGHGVDPYKPLAVGVLKHVTASEATQTDPTNFEPAGGSTIDPVSVTTHWYNQPCRVGPTDLNNGLRMEDLRTKAVATFADKITQVATAPIVAGTFTATPVISAPEAFGWSDAATLRGSLKKSPIKNLILDGDYMARLENQPTNFQNTGVGNGDRRTFGWDGIYEATNWAGAGANIRGFACNPQAIVRVTGLPLNPPNIPGGIFSTTIMELPELGIAIAISTWFSTATRTMFVSWDVIAGFAAGDATAGVIVASGNPG